MFPPYKSRLQYAPQQPQPQPRITSYEEAMAFVEDFSKPQAIQNRLGREHLITVDQAVSAVVHRHKLLCEWKEKAEQSYHVIHKYVLIPSSSRRVERAKCLYEKLALLICSEEKTPEYKYHLIKTKFEENSVELRNVIEEIKTLAETTIPNLNREINKKPKQDRYPLERDLDVAKAELQNKQKRKSELELQIEALIPKISKLQINIQCPLNRNLAINFPLVEAKPEQTAPVIVDTQPSKNQLHDFMMSDIAKMHTIQPNEWIYAQNEIHNGQQLKVSTHSSGNFQIYQNQMGWTIHSKTTNNFYDCITNHQSTAFIPVLDESICLSMEQPHWKSDDSLHLGKEYRVKRFIDEKGRESKNGYKKITITETNKTYLVDKYGINYEQREIQLKNKDQAIIGSQTWVPMKPCLYQFTCMNGQWQKAQEIQGYMKVWVVLPNWFDNDPNLRMIRSRDETMVILIDIDKGENTFLQINRHPSVDEPFIPFKLSEALFRARGPDIFESCGQTLPNPFPPLPKPPQHQGEQPYPQQYNNPTHQQGQQTHFQG